MRPTVEASRLVEVIPRRCLTEDGRRAWLVPQGVAVSWTPCTFGGKRPWLVCPRCQRRALRLYHLRAGLLCRRCVGLVYRVQQVPRFRRLQLAQERIRRRLGGTGEPCEDFPARPDGMHWRTYQRLQERHDRLEAAEWADAARQGASLIRHAHARQVDRRR